MILFTLPLSSTAHCTWYSASTMAKRRMSDLMIDSSRVKWVLDCCKCVYWCCSLWLFTRKRKGGYPKSNLKGFIIVNVSIGVAVSYILGKRVRVGTRKRVFNIVNVSIGVAVSYLSGKKVKVDTRKRVFNIVNVSIGLAVSYLSGKKVKVDTRKRVFIIVNVSINAVFWDRETFKLNNRNV